MMAHLDLIGAQDPALFEKLSQEIVPEIYGPAQGEQQTEEDMYNAFLAALSASGGGGARYIDVPTPEEFLDDFRTAFLGNVKTFTETGTLNRAEMEWAQNNWDVFANEYVGALAQKAQKGEEVFKVIGAGGAETPVGTEGAGVGETQPVVQRPGVAVVHALTPTDWLNQVYPEEKLNLFIAGHMPSVTPRGGAGVAAYGRPRSVY
jgi:hypothetical protein